LIPPSALFVPSLTLLLWWRIVEVSVNVGSVALCDAALVDE
jgi:hypothetical protein